MAFLSDSLQMELRDSGLEAEITMHVTHIYIYIYIYIYNRNEVDQGQSTAVGAHTI